MDRRDAQLEYGRIKTDLQEICGWDEDDQFWAVDALNPDGVQITLPAADQLTEVWACLRALVEKVGERQPADTDAFSWAEDFAKEADKLLERAKTALRGGGL